MAAEELLEELCHFTADNFRGARLSCVAQWPGKTQIEM